MFFNNVLINYFSKRQNTLESRTFVSELIALRIAREIIVDIRIKLKVFGVPLDGTDNILCDNNGVLKNTRTPESTLSNNHNAIKYHCVCEASAAGIMRTRKEETAINLDNPLTKLIT